MTTKNPKIAGYVSQEIFDRFVQFHIERQLSMSQAVGVILSEYFGLQPPSEPPSEPSSGLLSELLRRIEVIEEKISELPSGSPSGSLPVIEDSIPITITPSPSPPVTISWGAIHTLAGLVPPKSRNTYNAQIIIASAFAKGLGKYRFDTSAKNFHLVEI